MIFRDRYSSGLTFVEIAVSIAIIAILISVGLTVFINARKQASLSGTTDNIAAILEQTKTNAMSGKNGKSHGLYIASTSYTTFIGDSYSSSDPANKTYPVNSPLTLSSTLTLNTVIFKRLSGIPNGAGTISIVDTSSSKTQTITIGEQGDILITK